MDVPRTSVRRRRHRGHLVGPRRTLPVVVVVVLVVSLSLTTVGPAPGAPGDEPGVTSRVSVASDGAQWPGRSFGDAFGDKGPAISADARHVAFVSSGRNLDPSAPPTTGTFGSASLATEPDQVFVRDRLTGKTSLVSASPAGVAGNRDSGISQPAISANGRYVAFDSDASNLVGPAHPPRVTTAPDLLGVAPVGGTQLRLTFDEPAWNTCPGTGPCDVAMRAPRSITAGFRPGTATLAVTRTGQGVGVVTSAPAGISCGATCAAQLPVGTSVTLTATAGEASTFTGWGGACSGTQATCTLVMSGARSVTASFSQESVDLTVNVSGPGTVHSAGGLVCPNDSTTETETCNGSFGTGTSASLSATPAEGGELSWSTDTGCKANERTCVVKMDANKVVTVFFGSPPNVDGDPMLTTATRQSSPGRSATPSSASELTVATAGPGSGRVTSAPPGINCTVRCSADFSTSTSVTLTAVPSTGSVFTGWSGYRVVLLGGDAGDVELPCELVSGDGTGQHVVDCPGLHDNPGLHGNPGTVLGGAYVETGTVDDRAGGGGNANPLQARPAAEVSAPAETAPQLVEADLDLGGKDQAGREADVLVYRFSEPVSLVNVRNFAAYTPDAQIVAPIEASTGVCSCLARVVFPDGSLTEAVGASVLSGAVREVVPTGGTFQPNLTDEVGVVNPGGDTNGYTDVFVFDRDEDENGVFDEADEGSTRTTKVSVGILGRAGNRFSSSPAISADGRFVAFQSSASNLLGARVESGIKAFLPASGAAAEAVGPAPPPSSGPDTNDLLDVFVHDRDADADGSFDDGGSGGATTRVSVADDGSEGESGPLPPAGDSFEPSISATGRYVAFTSGAVNLIEGVPGGADTNDTDDVFVRDRDADGDGIFDEPLDGATATRRVSVASDGSQLRESLEPAISADGRIVAFTNNVSPDRFEVLAHDRDADGNGTYDETGPTARATAVVSLSQTGVAGDGNSYRPAISGDGRYVSFFSLAGDLVGAGDAGSGRDVFIRDRLLNRTSMVAVAPNGTPGNDDTDSSSSLSGDGRYVAFASDASNLVPGDTNDVQDVFVRDRIPVARLVPGVTDFGGTELGDRSGAASLQLANVGVGALPVTGVAVDGPAAADFRIDAESCTGTTLQVEPGQLCSITVSFSPRALGDRRASVVVTHDPAPERRSVASLVGTGLVPPFTVSPNPLDLGPVGVGLSAAGEVRITNLAQQPQSIGALAIGGDQAPEFTIVGAECPPSLLRQASCVVRIRFAPGAVGPRAATLTGSVGPQAFTVALSGSGAPGGLTVTPDPVDFGGVIVGSAADRTVTIGNGGVGLLRITGLATGPDASGFTRMADDCIDVVLAPGATCTVTVRLTATEAGPRQGTLAVQASIAGLATTAEVVARLVGTGLGSVATIAPNPVDFGPVDTGTPARRSVTVTSEGPAPLTTGPATIGGPEAADFSIVSDRCAGRRVAAGSSCTLELEFVPGTGGARGASLSIPGAGVVGLQGTGVVYTPVVTLSVNAGPPGTVTVVQGTGFRPNADIELRWVAADTRPGSMAPLTVTTNVRSDGDGRFGPTQVLVFPRDLLGPRTLQANGTLPGTFATASFLVVPATAQPAGQDVFLIHRTQLVSRR